MGNWKGNADSRPEPSAPKAGSIDRMSPAKNVKIYPRGSESFADREGGGKGSWKGQMDNRPGSGK